MRAVEDRLIALGRPGRYVVSWWSVFTALREDAHGHVPMGLWAAGRRSSKVASEVTAGGGYMRPVRGTDVFWTPTTDGGG